MWKSSMPMKFCDKPTAAAVVAMVADRVARVDQAGPVDPVVMGRADPVAKAPDRAIPVVDRVVPAVDRVAQLVLADDVVAAAAAAVRRSAATTITFPFSASPRRPTPG